MGQINSISDGLVAATANATNMQLYYFYKTATSLGTNTAQAIVSATYCSFWTFNGQPSYGSVPGAAAIPTRTTAGAMGQANASTGKQRWLVGASLQNIDRGTFVIGDRLAHMGGLSGTSVAVQSVNATAGRYTTATTACGNEIYAEIYTQIGATPTTITASYTNEDGTNGRTTQAVTFGGTSFREVTRMIYLPLQAGDNGVISVENVTLAGTTGTAGNFGITIMRKLFTGGNPVGSTSQLASFVNTPGPVEVKDDACLWLSMVPVSAAAPSDIIIETVFLDK